MINSAERWTMLILRFSVGKKRVPSVVVELMNQTTRIAGTAWIGHAGQAGVADARIQHVP